MKKVVSIISVFMIIFIAGCEPAEIYLHGKSEIYLDVFDDYVDEGALISKGELITTGVVDTNKVGTYVIRYENEDGDIFVERTVHVEDHVNPVIEFTEDTFNSFAFLGENYTIPGARATDNYDESIELVVTGNVDTSKEGEYELVYEAVDSSGNSTTEKRVVEVIDPEPELLLNGNSEIVIFTTDEYYEVGASAYDAFGNELEVVIEGEVKNDVGVYELKYSTTDEYGHRAELVRTVRVGDLVSKTLQLDSVLEATEDGGYLVLTRDKLSLQKIKDGKEIFNLTNDYFGLGLRSHGNTLIEDSENNIVVAYKDDDDYITKLNSDGEEIWTWTRDRADSFTINSLTETDEGYFYIGYLNNDDNIIYGLVDDEGNFEWERSYNPTYETYVDDQVYYNGEMYLLLFTFNDNKASLTGVRVSNATVWTEYPIEDGWIYDLEVMDDVGVVGLGGYNIFKIDAHYNKENIISLPQNYRPFRFEYVGNEKFVLLNSNEVFGINSNSDILFNKEYPEPFNNFVRSSVNENDLIVEYVNIKDSVYGFYNFINVSGK